MISSVLNDPEFPAVSIHWECELRRSGQPVKFLGGHIDYPALPYDALPSQKTARRLVHVFMRNGIYPLRKTRGKTLR
jgi:hypothetical protein